MKVGKVRQAEDIGRGLCARKRKAVVNLPNRGVVCPGHAGEKLLLEVEAKSVRGAPYDPEGPGVFTATVLPDVFADSIAH